MADSAQKKEQQKKKAQEKREKAEKMKMRKADGKKSKSLEDMMAYVDEYGNIVNTPPDPTRKRTEISLDDIMLGAAKIEEEIQETRTGTVSFFNEAKGYGFIIDNKNNQNIFVHMNNLLQPVKERDRVSFEIEKTPRGLAAIKVAKVK